MARAHWRFVVRDQQGRTISNAKVFAYQPGTTTDFLGTAHTAVTGGFPVTNPMTTNSQGEAEAWFTTPQPLDVLVTDNNNLATIATTGAVADFPSFTEQDDVYPPSADYTSLATNPHTHSSHTDVTRSIWLSAQTAALIDGATASTLGITPNNVPTIQLDDAVSEGVSWLVDAPDDFSTGIPTITCIWSPSVTVASSAVRFQFVVKSVIDTGDITATGTTTAWTGTSTTHTANMVYRDSNTAGVAMGAGAVYLVNVRRIGGDAADTLNASIVHLLGILINYTAKE